MNKRQSTPEERKQIAAMYVSGLTNKEIRQQTGRTSRCLAAILREHGIPLKKPRTVSAEHLAIAAAYTGGESMVSIRDRTGRSPNYIWLALKKTGTERRPDDWWMIPESERLAIIDAYKSGETYKKISERTGRDVNNIRRFIKESGMDVALQCGLNKSAAHQIYTLNEGYFDDINTEEKAWIHGFIAADGCVHISKNKHALLIGLAAKDAAILETIKTALGYSGPTRFRSCKFNGNLFPQAAIAISSVRLVNALKASGIVERKSLILKPWNGPPELMRHWWRGVFDGDGSWSQNHSYLVGSTDIIKGFCKYAKKVLGIKLAAGQKAKNERTWHCIANKAHSVALAAHLYSSATISLQRKWDAAKRIITPN